MILLNYFHKILIILYICLNGDYILFLANNIFLLIIKRKKKQHTLFKECVVFLVTMNHNLL